MKNAIATTNNSAPKTLLLLTGYFAALFALFLISNIVFAQGQQTIGDVAGNVTKTMGNVGKLIVAASYVAGVGFALMGMLKFKAHKEQPQQVPLSQPIVLLAIAAGLIFLPSLLTTGGTTIFGTSGVQGDTTGGNVEGLK